MKSESSNQRARAHTTHDRQAEPKAALGRQHRHGRAGSGRGGTEHGLGGCFDGLVCSAVTSIQASQFVRPPSNTRPSTFKQLARLQQQFVEGKHTDMVIRVHIKNDQPPAPKRPRTTRATAAAADPVEYTDIKAHSLVLRTHSPYFDKGLSDDWAEAAERRVELAVEDEQAVEDLKLLIKLSYSTSFTHDGGQLLPLDTRLRLGARADSLEFVEAVDQMVASLPLGLGLEGATTCLAAVPAALEEHPGMEAVRKQVVALLVKGIEERDADTSEESKVLVQRGVDALARLLGPVHEMFYGAGTILRVCEDVLKLPLCVFKRVVASEALQLQLENEAYTLLTTWLKRPQKAWDGINQRTSLFKEMALLLRYQHMTSHFLANVVSQCRLMKASGLLPLVVHAALIHREASPALLERAEAASGLDNRGRSPSETTWEVKASFTLEEVAALEQDSKIFKSCGLIAGYEAWLSVERTQNSGLDALDADFSIVVPKINGAMALGRAGVGLKWRLALSPNTQLPQDAFFFDGRGRGFDNVFMKPWAEVVREGSPHFPGGKLEFTAAAKLVVKE